MIEDEEQNISVLRKRHRTSGGASNGSANGHAKTSANGHSHGYSRQEWGWTHSKNSSSKQNDWAETPREEQVYSRRRLTFNNGPQQPPSDAVSLPFDPWRLLIVVKRRWYWLLAGMVLLGGLGYLAGSKLFKYKVSVALIRRTVSDPMNPNENDPNKPRPLSDQTLHAFMRSGEVFRRVSARGAESVPPLMVTSEELGKAVSIAPSSNPDVLVVSISGSERGQRLADLANLYADEVARYTRDIQASESGDVSGYLAQKVQLAEQDWAAANQELALFQREAGFVNLDAEAQGLLQQISSYQIKLETAKIDLSTVRLQLVGLEKELKKQSPKQDKLKSAQEELEAMLVSKTREHPDVILQQRKIDALKASSMTTADDGTQVMGSGFGNALYLQSLELKNKEAGFLKQVEEYEKLLNEARQRLAGLSDKGARYASLKAKAQALDATRQTLAQRQQNMRLFVENAMGYYRVHSAASEKDIDWKRRAMKVSAVAALGAGFGLLAALALAFFLEASDTRLKTISDIERSTRLPVLATLGDLTKMSPNDQINWAFRTLTILRGKLCASPDDALVCGLISSGHGEGRSTWVNLLVSAASQRGLRVLTVDTRPTAEGPRTEPRPPQHETRPMNPEPDKAGKTKNDRPRDTDLENSLLAKPLEVAARLKDPESIVHIPIPGWVWSLERRQQWQEALSQWREIDNTVILIELPPASCPEAILLAEKIPQLIWLVGSGMADVKETKEQLETLRHAHCNIVGAALNQAPPHPLRSRITRWFTKTTALILLGLGMSEGQAQEKLAFSGAANIKRAAWQERLTLGPGDAMDITLYGQPDLARTNIFVGPDGRISYLQVQGLQATGLTIEELRDKLNQELGKYYPVARTIVTPTVFASKKYYVLGKVVSKGVYPLDRPMTLLEAVARAQGLETGLYDRNTVEMADLSRSFLIRKGERQKVDMEKLFYEGDLGQNIVIEPDDFIFFGSAALREIYVLGQVMNPGPIGFVPNATLITAITDRGGFTDRAYKGKILVVRGSLSKPETFVVDSRKILDAAEPDFKLESRDIIYVAQRPWIRAEELLDEATQSFIQGFVTAFSGAKIGPFIKNPVFGD